MRSSKPPALATWLVEHLNPGGRNEALAGDLLEQFSQGRSVAWYWRQVLVAIIVGFTKEWRIFVLAAVSTAGWVFLFELLGHAAVGDPNFSFLKNHSGPVSLIDSMVAFVAFAQPPIGFASGIYAALTMDWTIKRSRRRVWLAQLASFPTVVIGRLLLMPFLSTRSHPLFVRNLVGLLPVFLGAVVVMWSWRPNVGRVGAFKFFRIDPPSNW
jgi:hypothetical protein